MLLNVLQENLLTLLAFDKQRSVIVRNTIDISLFGGLNKTIAARIYDYIDRYKKPPAAHLADILDDKINSANRREGDLYTDVLTSLHEAQAGINAEYVMAQMGQFIRRQSLRGVAIELAKELQKDTEDSLDKAQDLIKKAQRQEISVFDPGLRLGSKAALNFLDTVTSSFPTGVAELDRRGFGPTRKELWLYVANTKSGKTWMLIHLAKIAAVHRLKVCHITLELSEHRTAQRYFQALFAVGKRRDKTVSTRFELDTLGRITGFDAQPVKAGLALDDPHIRSKLERKIKTGQRTLDNVYIKEFATGSLTVNQLTAYLDNLENTERFTPDLLIIDYPDLMKLDTANYRLSIDQLYKDLRGMASERNIAVAAVSQSNRGAAKAKLVGIDAVAEAYTKIAHADTVLTFSQTAQEKTLGLGRLHVAAGRNDADNLTLVISQNYGIGQYIVDAAVMRGNYWGLIPRSAEADDTDQP